MGYQPWLTGQTYPSWDIPLIIDGGSGDDGLAEDLTGVDITKFTLIFHSNDGGDIQGTGTFSIKRLFPAEVFYKPSPADVASAFDGSIYIKALFPPSNTTADEVIYDPIPFKITAW